VAEDEGMTEDGSPPRLTMSERWALVAPHHEHMLAVARRRCATEEDAEDCVQEAMLRVARFERLDPDRVAAMLTSVTTRLIVDMHRVRARELRYRPRLVDVPEQLAPPDEAALDTDEARWLASRVEDLPERERAVFTHRAAGFSVGEAAARLNLTYKSVESAFTRARGRLRLWAGAGALLVAEYVRRLRVRQHPAAMLASLAMVSAGCLVLSSLSRSSPPETGARQAPPAAEALTWSNAAALSAPAGNAATPAKVASSATGPAAGLPGAPGSSSTRTAGRTIFHTGVPGPPADPSPLIIDLSQYETAGSGLSYDTSCLERGPTIGFHGVSVCQP